MVLLISSTGWGLTWLPIKTLNDMGLDSMHLIFIAFLSGALLMLPWLFKQYRYWKQSLVLMLLIGLSGGIANASFQTAIFHGDVIRVMILFYMLPIWSVLGGRIFLKEKIDAQRMIAVMLCLSGAFLILDVWQVSWKGIGWIDLLAIASGMGLAATNILFRYTQSIPVMSKVASMFIGCTALIGLSMGVTQNSATLPGGQAVMMAVLYGAVWLSLITLGTQWAVTQIEASRSAILIVMELVVAVATTAILTQADLGPYEILGGLLVMSAALIEGIRDDTMKDEVAVSA